MVNRQFVLASRPVGMPKESDLRMVETPVPALRDSEVLLRALYLLVDPYMRGRMNAAKSYAPSVEIGELMVGGGVARVVDSKNPGYEVGDVVNLQMGWQEYAVSNGEGLRKIDPHVAPVSTALGVLGMPGLTAYFGLLEVCGVNAGETVVVSAAAGAVGSVVGQIAKIKGCRAVGIAGGPEKTRYVTEECGFDAALDYKATTDYLGAIQELCPGGVDVYFDNVGGATLNAMLPTLKSQGRIVACGMISDYNRSDAPYPITNLWQIVARQLTMQGFLLFTYDSLRPAARAQLAHWFVLASLRCWRTLLADWRILRPPSAS